jgi:hypothetical protein
MKFIADYNMKRIIAVFLLIVTSFASGHATLAFHYCGGNLHDVGFYTAKHACCCQMTAHRESCGDRTGVENAPCCVNHFISLVTDDYPNARQEITLEPHHDFQPMLFAVNDLFRPCESASLLQHIFPPDSSARHCTAKLLHLICTYRI